MGGDTSGNYTCESSHPSIFNRENLDVITMTIVMICLILFTIGVEVSLHKIHSLVKGITHWTGIFNKITQELMILGLISFALVLVLDFSHPPEEQLLVFEFAHLWFFFVALVYVVHALTFNWANERTKSRWHLMDTLSASMVVEERTQANVQERSENFYLFCGSDMHKTQLEYLIFRNMFSELHNLPKDFSFPKYLHSAMDNHITGALDVRESTWGVLIVLLGLNVIRSLVSGTARDEINYVNELMYYMALGWVLLFVLCMQLVLIRRAKAKLLQNIAKVKNAESLHETLQRVTTLASVGQTQSQTPSASLRHFDTFFDLLDRDGDATTQMEDVFPFNSPWAFSKVMDVILLLQCFYVGIVFMLMITMATTVYPGVVGYILIFLYIFPMLLSIFWIFPKLIAQFVFVKSVGYLDQKTVKQVVEWTEDIQNLKREFARRIHYNMAYSGGKDATSDVLTERNKAMVEEKLLAIFKEHDTNGDEKLNYTELKNVLTSIGLEISFSQFRRLSYEFDANRDGSLNYKEFVNLILGDLPDDPFALFGFFNKSMSLDQTQVMTGMSSAYSVTCNWCKLNFSWNLAQLESHQAECKSGNKVGLLASVTEHIEDVTSAAVVTSVTPLELKEDDKAPRRLSMATTPRLSISTRKSPVMGGRKKLLDIVVDNPPSGEVLPGQPVPVSPDASSPVAMLQIETGRDVPLRELSFNTISSKVFPENSIE